MSCHHEWSRCAGPRGICFSDNRQLVTDNQIVIPSAAEGPVLRPVQPEMWVPHPFPALGKGWDGRPARYRLSTNHSPLSCHPDRSRRFDGGAEGPAFLARVLSVFIRGSLLTFFFRSVSIREIRGCFRLFHPPPPATDNCFSLPLDTQRFWQLNSPATTYSPHRSPHEQGRSH
jgi:hypothetical protein